jgi:hypothetical protein
MFFSALGTWSRVYCPFNNFAKALKNTINPFGLALNPTNPNTGMDK